MSSTTSPPPVEVLPVAVRLKPPYEPPPPVEEVVVVEGCCWERVGGLYCSRDMTVGGVGTLVGFGGGKGGLMRGCREFGERFGVGLNVRNISNRSDVFGSRAARPEWITDIARQKVTGR